MTLRQRAPSLQGPLTPPETIASMDDSYSHQRTSSIHYNVASTPRLGHSADDRPVKLILVTPPANLPHDPPSVTAAQARAFGSPDRFKEGILIPLQLTLNAQLAVIAREYALPSIVGLSLHVTIQEDGQVFKPKITTDEAWSACWSEAWEGQPAGHGSFLKPRLPIVGKLEFDIDERKARWYAAYKREGTLRLADIVHQAVANSRIESPASSPLSSKRASIGQRRLLLEDRPTPSPSVSPRLSRRPKSPRSPPRPLQINNRSLSSMQEVFSPLIGSITRATPSDERGVPAPVDANEAWNASWPPTPDSPERLPSASLADRIAPSSPSEEIQYAFATIHNTKYVPSPGPALIGQDTEVRMRMRPLKDISEPSPVLKLFEWRKEARMDPRLARRDDLRYPYSLSDVYPSVGMPRLYPRAAASNIWWPLRLDVGARQVKRAQDEHGFLLSPLSPARLASASLADRLASSSAEDEGYAAYRSSAALPQALWTPAPQLIGVDREMQSRMRTMTELSEATPSVQSFQWQKDQRLDPWLRRREDLLYPFSLSSIYPSSNALDDIYPRPGASRITWPVARTSPPAQLSTTTFGYPSSLSVIYPALINYPPRPYPPLAPVRIIRPAPPPPPTLVRRSTPPALPPPLRTLAPTAQTFLALADPFATEEDDDETLDSLSLPYTPSTVGLEQYAVVRGLPTAPRISSPPLAHVHREGHDLDDWQSVRSAALEPLPSNASASFPAVPGSSIAYGVTERAIASPRSLGRSSLASSILSSAPLQPEPILFTFPTKGELSCALGQFLAEAVEQSVQRRGRFTIAISGGSLPALLAPSCVGHPDMQWDRWEVFYADQRIVPPDHADSSHRLCDELLWSRVPIPGEQIHQIKLPASFDAERSECSAGQIADAYERELLDAFAGSLEKPPSFDLILLGLGADGHTASLFPGHALLAEQDYYIASHDSPQIPSSRITFTYPLLNAARRVAFIVSGGKVKVEAMVDTLDQGTTPAAGVALPYRPVVYFATEEAAAGVRSVPRSRFWDEE